LLPSVRRGDFQYKNTRIDADEILKNIQDVIPPNTTVFIATDERYKGFFKPLQDYYHVKFLDDYQSTLLTNINKNFYGMIDQLVAARGRNFYGCWHSTFTGYIMRMRGYHAAREQAPGYLDGVLPSSYYYVPKNERNAMHQYAALQGAFFNREFPTSWRQLDFDVKDQTIVDSY
jgi:GDP-fucose protein O-fucosyltransferase